MEDIRHGVAIDPRPETEKALDYLHEQKYSGLPVTWVEKSIWKLPSERIQDGSSSCVAQSHASAIEVLTNKIISAGTYKLRSNFPEQGMWLQNMGDIAKNTGIVAEIELPSQNLNEIQMNNLNLPTSYTIKATGYAFCSKNIDQIAEAIQAYGNCLLTFNSNSSEWNITPTFLNGTTTFGHCILGVDYGFKSGVKVIACRDSAGSSRIRYITEDFLINRNTGAMYFTGTTVTPVTPKLDLSDPKQWNFFLWLLKFLRAK